MLERIEGGKVFVVRIAWCLIEWRAETIFCGNRELLERVEICKVLIVRIVMSLNVLRAAKYLL